MKNYSEKIAKAIYDFLMEDNWKFSFDEEEGRFDFSLTLKKRINEGHYTIKVRNADYCVYVDLPFSADKKNREMMMNMAEFIVMVNYGLRCGGFDMDIRDGEVRYRVFMDCEGMDAPTKEMIINSIIIPAMMIDHFAEGFLQVMFNNMPARKAFALCDDSYAADLSETEDLDGDVSDIIRRLN